MSASGPQNIQENVSPNPTAGNGPEIKPRIDPDDPLKNASPNAGDSWTTVPNAEIEEDKVRCDAWKDEVQNLLIFVSQYWIVTIVSDFLLGLTYIAAKAGLFSAVVTAFVIESYKLLQPDPNDAITGLLFHIANGLNNSSPLPPSLSSQFNLTPFTQPSAAVRINVFWFISLIFSLATVLVGTIALQWLREYQSYIGYSGKEKVAILHMRRKAIEAWYLPQVFAALPLLLQAALTLFLAGLIDFSLLLGRKLTIPVCIAIGATLFFLAATTLLPSLQGLWLLFGIYPRKAPPTPCPYKSPQSHLFRILLGKFLCQIFLRTKLFSDLAILSGSGEYRWISIDQYFLIPEHLASHVRTMWCQRSWLTFDREWLSLRDACHQRILDTDPELANHRFCWNEDIPLSDVTQYFVEVANQASGTKHTELFLNALVSCFREVSESIWTAKRLDYSWKRKDRRNHYFEQLLDLGGDSVSTFLLHGGAYQFDRFGRREHMKLDNYIGRKTIQRLFIDEQMVLFLSRLLRNDNSPTLARSQIDLWSNVLNLSGKVTPLTPLSTDSTPYPFIFPSLVLRIIYWTNFGSSAQKYSAIADMLTTIFELAASHRDLQDPSMGSICASKDMAWVVDYLARVTAEYLELEIATVDGSTGQHGELWDVQLPKLFDFISANLRKEQSNLSSNPQDAPWSVLFYFSSALIYHVLHRTQGSIRDNTFGRAFMSARDALYDSWSRMQQPGSRNVELERGFHLDVYDFDTYYTESEWFSPDWWQKLFKDIQKGPALTEELSSDAHPGASSENQTEDDIGALLGSPDHPGDPPANLHPNSSHDISGCKPASNSINHVDNSSIPYSLSDLPAVSNHSATSTEDSEPPCSGNHIATGAAQPQSLPTSKDPGSVVPTEQAAGNEIRGRNDEHDLQLRRDHSAIDFEPPNLEQASLAVADPEDAVLPIESSI